ncbi:MAG TPA: hypothetical protein VK907_06260 [Phnomibacter sp.]|nr:hypothetical protein [Phnomibacter sp.]
MRKRSLPTPITILMAVIALAAMATWLLPAGQYSKLSVANGDGFALENADGVVVLPLEQRTLDSLGIRVQVEKFRKGEIRKAISVPDTYRSLPSAPQGLLAVLMAPIKGIYDSIDIILLVLVIGGFVSVFDQTGALVRGIGYISHIMRGRESWLIVILTTIFSFLGSSYGMAEESLVFYPLLVPLFLAAGYDLLVPFAVIFGGVTIGGISSFSNPFSTIIASNAAGFNWMDGLVERLAIFGITTLFFIVYLMRYAARVKADPSRSLVARIDGKVTLPFDVHTQANGAHTTLDLKTWLLLAIYFFTFVAMILGVILLDWWTLEMSTLFLASSLLVGIVHRIKENVFVAEFIKGAESLLSVAFIIGVARGVTVVLNEGLISDTILYEASKVVAQVPAWLFILLLFMFYFFFSLFISSTSGMAVLTMPIIGALAIMVNIPGREVVNAYIFGMNIMALVSPTSLVLPSLAMINMSFGVWMKFIRPVMLVYLVLCAIFLLLGIYL